jgi:hypothetical protein
MSDSNGVARDGESVLILKWNHQQGTLTIGGKIANKPLGVSMLAIADIELRAQIADERHGSRVAVAPHGVLKMLERNQPS